MRNKVVMGKELPPLELWADGIAEYVSWKDGAYHINPDAPEWAKEKLKEYNSLLNPKADENGILTQY